MPNFYDASQCEFPLAALIDAIGSAEAESKWAKLHSAQETARAALEKRRAELNTLYQRAAAPETGWEEITQIALMVGEWARAAAEKLRPQLDAFQQRFAALGNGIPLEVQESVDIAEEWLALYRDLRRNLLRLAAKRRPADVVLRARPVEGEIDYAELSREHLARFPKIRAALAK
jgi:acyl carrier protein phosphodiesterase